ncbi:MAG TPA: hypothetical protein VKV57_01375 [bacterium]|nr:hypothetical protein [bacterium]
MARFFNAIVSDGRLNVAGPAGPHDGSGSSTNLMSMAPFPVQFARSRPRVNLNRAIQDSHNSPTSLPRLVDETLMDAVRAHWEQGRTVTAMLSGDNGKQIWKEILKVRRQDLQRRGREMERD